MDVPALRSRFSLVAEHRPYFLLVIERHHQPAADALEKRLAFHLPEQRDALRLPVDVGIGDAVLLASELIEASNSLLDHRFGLRIGARLHVIALHSDGIKTISQTVMRIDVTRNLDQGSHRLRLEILDLKTPSFVPVDDRRAGNDQRGGAAAGSDLP